MILLNLWVLFHSLLIKLGLADFNVERTQFRFFCSTTIRAATAGLRKDLTATNSTLPKRSKKPKNFCKENIYDAIFLDHDLLPHHYESNDHDDFASTGYAIAEWSLTKTANSTRRDFYRSHAQRRRRIQNGAENCANPAEVRIRAVSDARFENQKLLETLESKK